ncbi:hypothetical protein AB6F89_02860 [Providencia hangzhouensis]|uniref:hypothetical protein n=1 Tax=Providencia hangzhouensis TaxID=3031799 RepID=UPI0029C443F2|nr:hypothetical protein [Providencia rettgeri]HEM8140322.1 hypothetical protein [Providencia rettgeri]
MSKQGNPSQNSTPNPSSENAQLQWVIKELNRLSSSHEVIKVTLENHITNISDKVDNNHSAVKENLKEKCDSIHQKINDKHETMLSKIDDKNAVLKESISKSEQTVLNKIKDLQSSNIKWFIGLAVAAGIALYRVFSSGA